MSGAERPDRANLRVVSSPRYQNADEPIFTVKDVATASGLPQPVIAQLIARTWTDDGWMYTAAQLHTAVEMAHQMRAARIAAEQSPEK